MRILFCTAISVQICGHLQCSRGRRTTFYDCRPSTTIKNTRRWQPLKWVSADGAQEIDCWLLLPVIAKKNAFLSKLCILLCTTCGAAIIEPYYIFFRAKWSSGGWNCPRNLGLNLTEIKAIIFRKSLKFLIKIECGRNCPWNLWLNLTELEVIIFMKSSKILIKNGCGWNCPSIPII